MKKANYIIPLIIFALIAAFAAIPTSAADFAHPAFEDTWAHTDKPVSEGQAVRTWIWGPKAFTEGLQEAYVEGSLANGSTGQRLVQYYDKSRMEVTDPQADSGSIWYITNGLLSTELISGRMQIGDNTFEARAPARVNVAGDSDDPNGPQYASFGGVLQVPAQPIGVILIQRINRAGQVTDDPTLAGQNIHIGSVDSVTNHGIAAPFWDFMNSSGTVYENGQLVEGELFATPVFATGRPLTEPYWANVLVAGQDHLVLIQCFERRCLTYTPANSPTWQVEMGNIGQHYHAWRYTSPAPTLTPTATATTGADIPAPTVTATATQLPATDYAYSSKFGSPSLSAREMQAPLDLALDSDGNAYVVDRVANRVQKFDQDGIWLLEWGSFGSGNTQFDGPSAITVDSENNVYVADSGNNRVQKFDRNGIWLLNFSSPATSGLAAANFLFVPTGIAADTLGNVYVSDSGSNQLRKYSSAGSLKFTFGGIDLLDSPFHVDVSPDDSTIYVADVINNRIQVFNAGGTFLRTLGAPGSGNADGQLSGPYGVAVSPDNSSIYVSDSSNTRIQVFDTQGTYLRKWSTIDESSGDSFAPAGLALRTDETVYVSDPSGGRIQSYETSDGSPISLLTDDSRGRFQFPYGITVTPGGRLVVVDLALSQVKIFEADGAYVTQWGDRAADQPVALSAPVDAAVDSQNMIYVTDANNNRVVKYNLQGVQQTTWGTPGLGQGAGNGEFNLPAGIDLDSADNVYVVDSGNNRVQKFSSTGTFMTAWGGPGNGDGEFTNPAAIAVHGNSVYVVDTGNSRVQQFDLNGNYQAQFGSAGSNESQFLIPIGIDTDAQGFIYVSDSGNDRIQKFTPTGVYLAQFGTTGAADGQLKSPGFLVVLPNGNVAVTETDNVRVQIFAPV